MIVLDCGILVVSILLVSSATVASKTTHVVHVKDSGDDLPDCLKEIAPCRSLEYVLYNIQEDMSWTVLISNSLNIPHNTFDLHKASVLLIGLINPLYIDFAIGVDIVNFTMLGFHNLSVVSLPQIRNTHIYKSTVEFQDCLVINSGAIWPQRTTFSHIYIINFTKCIFKISKKTAKPNGLTFDKIVVTYFNECNFYGRYTPFMFFTASNSPKFINIYIAQLIFDGCGFYSKSRLVIKKFYYNDYQSSWITCHNKFNLTINNCKFSNGLFRQSLVNSLISGGGEASWFNVTITNTVFSHNQLPLTEFSAMLLFKAGNVEIQLENVTFLSNIGAGISISNGILKLSNVSFINNTGKYSGGIIVLKPLYRFKKPQLGFKGNIFFKDNKFTDIYGGAIFMQASRFVQPYPRHQSQILFEDATQFIFFQILDENYKWCKRIHHAMDNYSINANSIKSAPFNLRIANHQTTLFPGQPVSLQSVNITDCYQHEAHCTATPTYTPPLVASCNESTCEKDTALTNLRNQVILRGKKLIFIHSTDRVQTSLYFTSEHEHALPLHNMVIKISCSNLESQVNVSLIPCPLGYRFISNESSPNVGTCEKAASNDTNLVYNTIQGVVCIRHNYWYGKMNKHNITAPCSLPYCAVGVPCPITGYTETHYRLPQTQDEQCNELYGGTLCRSCKPNSAFTFGASNCRQKLKCRNWHPYALLVTAIGVQMFITVFMIFLRPVTKLGVGYLYGPLFFLSVYKTLPISHTLAQGGSHLDIVLSLYQSILLLDLDILSKIPWCFFEDLDQTLVYSLRFLGPLVTFITITLIVLIARMKFIYKKFNAVFPSPIQPMCLLLMLSFWSLSDTSIEILKPVVIAGDWRFSIEPEHKYLGNPYVIVLQCIAMVLLTLVYIPFILFLCLSQFIRKKINLFRIQPFLDAFQSTFRISCHWYSGVYLLSWLILSINMPLYYLVIIFSGIVLLYFFIQPHKRRFMNACDVLLLMNMMILISVSFLCTDNYNCSRPAVIINYPFIILPLLYMLIGGVWLILKERLYKSKTQIAKIFYHSRNSLNPTALLNQVTDKEDDNIRSKMKCVSVTEVVMEREPLIYDD